MFIDASAQDTLPKKLENYGILIQPGPISKVFPAAVVDWARVPHTTIPQDSTCEVPAVACLALQLVLGIFCGISQYAFPVRELSLTEKTHELVYLLRHIWGEQSVLHWRTNILWYRGIQPSGPLCSPLAACAYSICTLLYGTGVIL